MQNTFAEIADALQNGRCKKVKDLVRMAVQEGCNPGDVLEKGLLKGMEDVGRRFEKEIVEIPEILAITRALNGGMEALKELSHLHVTENAGTVLIGTMRGDVHDIGKNLVRIMIESKGLRVVDLGVDVPAHRFLDAAQQERADVIVCSGFLQESIMDMRKLVEEFEIKGIRQDVYIMVGGAALDEEMAKLIGADCYTEDAVSCGEKAYSYCKKKKRKKDRCPKYLKETIC